MLRCRYAISQQIGTRAEQQDRALVRTLGSTVIAVLADGMGGRPMGAEAAALAVRVLTKNAWMPTDASEVFQAAHAEMRESLQRGSGAAVTVALLDLDLATVSFIWVGDVLGLTWDQGRIWQSKPHRRQRHVLARALTSVDAPEPEIAGPFPLQPGAKVALMSDGVWDVGADVRPLLRHAPRISARRMVQEMVRAPEGGDNATAVVMEVIEQAPSTTYQGFGRPPTGRKTLLTLLQERSRSTEELAAERKCSVRWVRRQLRLLLLDGYVFRDGERRWRAA